jgi:Fe-S-cluster containining protein
MSGPNSPIAIRIAEQDASLLRIVDNALADAARRSGEHLVCHPGCTQCCHGAFAISPLDALRLRAGMDALAEIQPSVAAAVMQRAQAYLEEYGPSFPGDPVTGILGASEDEQACFEDFANEAACPALDPATGLCDLYAARPMTCRVFGPPVRTASDSGDEAFSVCELCFTQATPEEIAAAEMHVPYVEEKHVEEALLAGTLEAGLDAPEGETIVAYCLVPCATRS